MAFLGIGIVLLLMKYFEVGPVATWSWFIVLAPFGLAILWWEAIVPLLGLDKKKGHNDLEEAKKERLKKQLQKKPGTGR